MTAFANTNQYPFTMVAYIEARFGQQWVTGSGVLVGRNDVLTAAHVIHNPVYGLADEVNVYFLYDPKAQSISYTGVDFDYYENYDPDGDGRLYAGDGRASTLGGSELDIVLISLSSAVGDIHGWMNIDFSYQTGQVNLSGYPAFYGRQLVNDIDLATRDARDHFIDIKNFEVNPGNSGGPIWYMGDNGPQVAGLVSTSIAAVSLSGHSWLVSVMTENDRLIQSDAQYYQSSDGDRVFVASGTSKTFLGGDGFDRVEYFGSRDDFVVYIRAAGIIDVQRPDGVSDTLTSIEKISFEDGSLLFDLPVGTGEQTYRMYQAAFGRTPDEDGFLFWVDTIDGLTTDQPGVNPLTFLAGQFLGADEFRDLYGVMPTDSAYVEALYRNVLLRAPEDAGYEFWLDQLENGASRADLLVAFSESVENQLNVTQDLDTGYWVI